MGMADIICVSAGCESGSEDGTASLQKSRKSVWKSTDLGPSTLRTLSLPFVREKVKDGDRLTCFSISR
jgi:hypothetical protein